MQYSKSFHQEKEIAKSGYEHTLKARILIVEDDDALLNTYATRFEDEGYIVVQATDGEQALELAVKERPDIIVTGILMPKLSGFDMINVLKSVPELKDIPVIIMSALSNDQDIDMGMKLGAVKYMVSSQSTLEELVTAVKQNLKK